MAILKIRNRAKNSDILKLRTSLRPLRNRLKRIAATSRSVDDFLTRLSAVRITPFASSAIAKCLASVNRQNYNKLLKSLPMLSSRAKRAMRSSDLLTSAINSVTQRRTDILSSLPVNISNTVQRMRMNGKSEDSILTYIHSKVPTRVDKQIDLQSTNTVHEANSEITAARSETIGVTTYIWRTMNDSRVRPLHAELEGDEFEFTDPPVCEEDGTAHNPGDGYNCRCTMEIRPNTRELDTGSTSILPSLGIAAGMALLMNKGSSSNTPELQWSPDDDYVSPDRDKPDYMVDKRDIREEILLQKESHINPKHGIFPRDRQIKKEIRTNRPKDGDFEIPLAVLPLLLSDDVSE